jgi:transmembrane sensor
MKDDLNYNLIASYLAGECTEGEKRNIEHRMKEDEEFAEAIREFEKIWNSKKAGFNVQWDKKSTWSNLEREMNLADRRVSVNKTKKIKQRVRKSGGTAVTWVIRAAAVFLVAGITSLFTILYMQDMQQEDPSVMREVVTERGQRATVHLDDGSRIKLNSASTLIHPREFDGDDRVVHLSGEGYFEIAADSRPFLVYADDAVIEILGTEFNVNAYEEYEQIEVVVADGKVSLRSNQTTNQEPAVLEKNEMGSLERTGNGQVKVTRNITLSDHLGWMDYQLQFEDRPMEEVAAKLERWYGVDVDFKDKEIQEMRLSAGFEDESIHEVLRVVSIALDIDYGIKGRRITLSKQY